MLLKSLATVSAALAFLSTPARAELATQKVLSTPIALTIAQTAYETCTQQGYKVSVTVVGLEGQVLAALRGTEAQRPFAWFALSVAACFLGMASKEVIVTAPVMVLLYYDRCFVSGSFREAWHGHNRLYWGLATVGCCWDTS